MRFSFAKLGNVEVLLGPEMRSTGEVLGLGLDLKTAMYKALLSANLSLKDGARVLATQNGELTPLLQKLQSKGVLVEVCKDYNKASSALKRGEFNLLIAPDRKKEDFILRRQAVEYGIPTISSPDTLEAILAGMDAFLEPFVPKSLLEYRGESR